MSAIFDQAVDQYHECRAAYQDYLYQVYAKAEAECRGRLLNRRGEKAGVDSLSLFSGNSIRAHAYASEELAEWWRANPRVTFEKFEKQWVESCQQGI